jgi:Flp pilus assembly protein TadG
MRFDRRGTAALEFALAALPLLTLMFGGFEFGRLQWTRQAMQLAGDQTARCVAISYTGCATPSTYASNTANTYGAVALVASNVAVTTSSSTCSAPAGNTVVQVTLSLNFTSPFSKLVPALGRTLTTTSCYPTTGN